MGMPVITSMPSTIMSSAPNTCKTPPYAVPMPLTSMGLTSTTLTTTQAFTVYTVGMPTSTMGSSSTTSMPVDATGTYLGNTGTIMGAYACTMGATRIYKSGKGTCLLSSSHSMNTMNTTGLVSTAGQYKVYCSL